MLDIEKLNFKSHILFISYRLKWYHTLRFEI